MPGTGGVSVPDPDSPALYEVFSIFIGLSIGVLSCFFGTIGSIFIRLSYVLQQEETEKLLFDEQKKREECLLSDSLPAVTHVDLSLFNNCTEDPISISTSLPTTEVSDDEDQSRGLAPYPRVSCGRDEPSITQRLLNSTTVNSSLPSEPNTRGNISSLQIESGDINASSIVDVESTVSSYTVWLTGACCVVALAPALSVGCIALTPACLVVALASISILLNIILAHIVLGEELCRWTISGSSCIAVGLVFVVVYAGKVTLELEQVQQHLSETLSVVYLISVTVLLCILCGIAAILSCIPFFMNERQSEFFRLHHYHGTLIPPVNDGCSHIEEFESTAELVSTKSRSLSIRDTESDFPNREVETSNRACPSARVIAILYAFISGVCCAHTTLSSKVATIATLAYFIASAPESAVLSTSSIHTTRAEKLSPLEESSSSSFFFSTAVLTLEPLIMRFEILHPFSYFSSVPILLPAAVVVTAILGCGDLFFMTKSLQTHQAVLVTPIRSCISCLAGTLGGVILFHEFPTNFLGFSAGLGLAGIGTVLVSQGQSEPRRFSGGGTRDVLHSVN